MLMRAPHEAGCSWEAYLEVCRPAPPCSLLPLTTEEDVDPGVADLSCAVVVTDQVIQVCSVGVRGPLLWLARVLHAWTERL